MAFAQSTISTITIAQPNLPSIAFSDSSVNVGIDADGNGVLSFQSLIDDGTVVIENQGTNSVRFELDRTDAQWQSVNADIDGTIGTATFEIPTFTEGHTVLYNGTHLAFHFDDPTYRGTTPSLPLQASLHVRAADQYPNNPNVDIDIGVTTFTITDPPPPPPPACETTLGAISLDFGTVNVGVITPVDGGTVVVENTGAVSADVNIGAGHWCEGPCFTGATSFPVQMFNSQTSFSADAGTLYAAKTAFTVHGHSLDAGAIIRGSTSAPFVLPPLFTLAADAEGTAYLQTNVVLNIMPGTAINPFEGDLEQEIIIESECG